jgi:hypothetical protein
MFVGLWAYARCRYYREFVELKKSEFKSILNYYNRLEAAINRIGNINEARLRVEAEAAGVAQEFSVRMIKATEAKGSPVYHVDAEFDEQYTISKHDCNDCKYRDEDMNNPPCSECQGYTKWEPREDGE